MLLVAGLINPEITEPVDNQLWDARSLMKERKPCQVSFQVLLKPRLNHFITVK